MNNFKAKVFIEKSNSSVYSHVQFKELLSKIFDNFKIHNIEIPKSGNVFIKPNVVSADTSISGITTDPNFIRSLIELLYDFGVKNVYVGDSSAAYASSEVNFQSSGIMDAITQAHGQFINIDKGEERISIDLPESDILSSISVPKKAYEADYLINFAKVKTHRIGSFTCCIKNYVGFIDQKTRLENHQTRLPQLVAELHKLMPSSINLGDGIIIGEGDGPDLCTPRFLGILLGSNDPVALDVIGAQLLGINHNELIFPWTAYNMGIGQVDPEKIEVLGANPVYLAINAKRPNLVLSNRFPCRLILGGQCEGCFAWLMGPFLFWERDEIWPKIIEKVGMPTILSGFNAKDINFEKHLNEGPYFVVGDCAPEIYRRDPRAIFIPGCCPGPAIPEMILKNCKVLDSNSI